MGAARAEPGSNPSQDPNRGGQRRPRGRSAPRCPCSRTSQDRVQTTTLVQSHEWPQNRAGACDVNALNGRAKAHKLWVLPGPIPSREKLHLQAATGPSRTPHPKKAGLPVVLSQIEATSRERSRTAPFVSSRRCPQRTHIQLNATEDTVRLWLTFGTKTNLRPTHRDPQSGAGLPYVSYGRASAWVWGAAHSSELPRNHCRLTKGGIPTPGLAEQDAPPARGAVVPRRAA